MSPKKKQSRIIKKILTIFLIVLSVLIIGVLVFLLTPYRATDEAAEVFSSSQEYQIGNQKFHYFAGDDDSDRVYLIYPGGRVEAKSYSLLCQQLADISSGCVIAQMKFNLAALPHQPLDKVVSNIEPIMNKKISAVGHSLGGPFLIRDILSSDYQDLGIDQLILLASVADRDLTDSQLEIFSIVGSKDKLIQDRLKESEANLPSNAVIEIIEGGNHSQWGDYGEQRGDGKAEISSQEQKEQFIKILLNSNFDSDSEVDNKNIKKISNNEDEYSSIQYEVNSVNITNPTGTTGDQSIDQLIEDYALELWEEYKLVSPPQYLQYIESFEVFNSTQSDTSAFVESLNQDSSKWRLSINLDSVLIDGELELNELSENLIHEFAHILSFNPTQTNIDKINSCDTILEAEGCLNPESYLYDFYQNYWDPKSQNNSNDFVSDYAATDYSEDFAESFIYYVFDEQDEFCCQSREKVLYFDQYQEFQDIKEFIQNNYGL